MNIIASLHSCIMKLRKSNAESGRVWNQCVIQMIWLSMWIIQKNLQIILVVGEFRKFPRF